MGTFRADYSRTEPPDRLAAGQTSPSVWINIQRMISWQLLTDAFLGAVFSFSVKLLPSASSRKSRKKSGVWLRDNFSSMNLLVLSSHLPLNVLRTDYSFPETEFSSKSRIQNQIFCSKGLEKKTEFAGITFNLMVHTLILVDIWCCFSYFVALSQCAFWL